MCAVICVRCQYKAVRCICVLHALYTSVTNTMQLLLRCLKSSVPRVTCFQLDVFVLGTPSSTALTAYIRRVFVSSTCSTGEASRGKVKKTYKSPPVRPAKVTMPITKFFLTAEQVSAALGVPEPVGLRYRVCSKTTSTSSQKTLYTSSQRLVK